MNIKKINRIVLLNIVVGIILLGFYGSNQEDTTLRSFQKLHNSGTQDLYGHSAFGYRGWSRQGDSITYSFDASADIWVYAMDESQWYSFTEQNMLGTHLSTSVSGSGIFYPQYEARWYIVFFNYHSYSVSVTYDVSFSPIIRITNPTSPTQIFTESELGVAWDSYGISGGVTIDLYRASSYISTLEASTLNDGFEYCQIPETCIDGTDYRIKVTAPASSETDYSDYFTIIRRKIVVSRPHSTHTFVPRTLQNIEWYSRGTSSKVKIDLYANNSFLLEIINETQDDTLFQWTVWLGNAYANITSSTYQIRIQDALNPKYYDFSSNFTILSERYLTILSPFSNSTFTAGSTIPIQWETNTPCDEVKIELLHGNITIKEIIVDNTNSYELKIRSRQGGDVNYNIRITAIDNSTSASSEFFTIIPKLRVPGYNILMVIISICFASIYFYYKRHRKVFSNSFK